VLCNFHGGLAIRVVRVEHFSYPTRTRTRWCLPVYPYPTRAENCYPTRPAGRGYTHSPYP